MKPLEQQTCVATSVTPTADCPAADHLPSALTPQATPSPKPPTNTEAFTHALTQLTSANLKLGLTLAVVTASAAGHPDLNLVHLLRTRPRRDLIALFHKAAAARPSVTADSLLTADQQAEEASSLAEECDELVAGHEWCPGSVRLRELRELTSRLGDLASRIAAGHSEADRVGVKFDQIATDVPVKAEPYTSWAVKRPDDPAAKTHTEGNGQ